MIFNWKLLGLPIVLTAVLAARVNAQAPDPNYERLSIKLKELSDTLEKVRTDVSDLKFNIAILQKTLTQLPPTPSTSGYGTDPSRDLAEMLRLVERMRQDIEELKRQPEVTTVRKPVSTDLGRVVLVNRYPEEITVMVNQTSYRLLPAERRELALPAGTFTYWVPLSQSTVQNRILVPNETKTIIVQ